MYSRIRQWMSQRTDFEQKLILWVLMGVGSVLAAAVWTYITRPSPPAPFTVVMNFGHVLRDREQAMEESEYWILPNGEHGLPQVRVPAAAAFVFSITNMQSVSTTIESLRLEATGTDERWATLTRLQTASPAELM